MATAPASDLHYDPWDSESRHRTFQIYQELLEHAPVYRTGSGYWVISRYADVRQILSRADLFSARSQGQEAMGFNLPPDTEPDVLQRLAAIVAELPVSLEEFMSADIIIGADPPRHTHIRNIVNRGFTPSKLAKYPAIIETIVAECLDGLDQADSFEVVQQLAVPLPLRVIADVLSVEEEHFSDMLRWSETFSRLLQGEHRATADSLVERVQLVKEFADYFVPRIEQRRTKPVDDLISDLVRAQETETLSAAEAVLFLLLLMAAANETTTDLIGNTVVALLEHPDQLDLLSSRPELVPNAIEESLRYRSPIQWVFRDTTQEVVLSDNVVPEGARLLVLMGAANHDPREFPDPERFDVTRRTAHLAFGHGAHFCIGRYLAQIEARAAIGALLPHLSRFTLADKTLEVRNSYEFWGYKRIPLMAA